MKKRYFFGLFLVLGLGAAAISSNVANAKEQTVLICNSSGSYAYHSHKCAGLLRCKSNILTVTVADAKKGGRSACKICYK